LDVQGLPRLWAQVEVYFASFGPAVRLGVILSAARHFAAVHQHAWCAAAMQRWRTEFDVQPPAAWKRPALELWTAATRSLLRSASVAESIAASSLMALRSWGEDRLDQDREHSRTTAVDLDAWNRAAAALCASGVREVALYGAGRHTRDLLASGWPHGRLVVRTVLDDHMAGTQGLGLAVLEPAACPSSVEAVLISSRQHETTLANAAERAVGGRAQIVRVYRGSMAEPAMAA
jgi:hypothetical protein